MNETKQGRFGCPWQQKPNWRDRHWCKRKVYSSADLGEWWTPISKTILPSCSSPQFLWEEKGEDFLSLSNHTASLWYAGGPFLWSLQPLSPQCKNLSLLHPGQWVTLCSVPPWSMVSGSEGSMRAAGPPVRKPGGAVALSQSPDAGHGTCISRGASWCPQGTPGSLCAYVFCAALTQPGPPTVYGNMRTAHLGECQRLSNLAGRWGGNVCCMQQKYQRSI